MNYIIKITLIIVMQFIAISAYAASKPSAKPTIWEIVEATPKKTNILDDVVDATNLNDVVEATGRKLDYDRTPVDNKVYKARVNPRIPETKAAIGSNAMKKLLKVSGWGYAAVEGVKLLLEGIDWVMDPEAQSIWRYKPSDNPGYDCKNFGYKWQTAKGAVYRCPIDAANAALRERVQLQPNLSGPQVLQLCTESSCAVDISTLSATSNVGSIYVKGRAIYTPTGTYTEIGETIKRGEKIVEERDKEVLTEDALADYMLGTHKDFQDQKYKDKLPKPNTWTGVAQQFKPENKFEEENSPTVKITQEQLDQALPESEDTTVKPTEPDPETGEKGWKFPPFCSWATAVCEHFKWVQSDDDLGDDDDQEPDTSVLDREFDTTFSASGSCPPNVKIPFPPFGDLEIGGDKICSFFGYLKYGVLAACSFAAMLIVGAAVRGT